MKSFKEHCQELGEKVIEPKTRSPRMHGKSLKRALEDARKMDPNQKVFFRGMNENNDILFVSTYRKDTKWNGVDERDPEMQEVFFSIMRGLNVRNPVFVTGDAYAAGRFGFAYVVIPADNWTMFRNNDINDLILDIEADEPDLTDPEDIEAYAKKILAGYKKVTKISTNHESILRVKKYWLVKVIHVEKYSDMWFKPNKLKYKHVVQALEAMVEEFLE